MSTVAAGLARLVVFYREAGMADGPREARLLLAHVLDIEPAQISLRGAEALDAVALERAVALAARRRMGEPMSHLRGWRAFWGRRFMVDGRVLDPRPETECLVAAALEEPFADVLDIGSGSGCILLTLLAETQGTRGVGTDVSPDALAVARANAEALGLSRRAGFIEADWYGHLRGWFDLIVSNPPYIAAAEMAALQPELAHEPRIALTDEADGLSAYRAIAEGLRHHLVPGGRLLVEIGPTQGAAVSGILAAAGLEDLRLLPDLDGRDRVVSARAPAGGARGG